QHTRELITKRNENNLKILQSRDKSTKDMLFQRRTDMIQILIEDSIFSEDEFNSANFNQLNLKISKHQSETIGNLMQKQLSDAIELFNEQELEAKHLLESQNKSAQELLIKQEKLTLTDEEKSLNITAAKLLSEQNKESANLLVRQNKVAATLLVEQNKQLTDLWINQNNELLTSVKNFFIDTN
ncbi:MAG: hypothetical protein ACE5Q9_04475, partial [Nitrosopumilus sp.]